MDEERLKEQDEKNKAALKELYDEEIVEAEDEIEYEKCCNDIKKLENEFKRCSNKIFNKLNK